MRINQVAGRNIDRVRCATGIAQHYFMTKTEMIAVRRANGLPDDYPLQTSAKKERLAEQILRFFQFDVNWLAIIDHPKDTPRYLAARELRDKVLAELS